MSVQEMVLENRGKSAFVTNRTLGAVGMIFSPMMFLALFFYVPQPEQPNPFQLWASLGGVLYIIGALAAATAVRNLRVTGRGRGAAVLYVVQMVGLFLAMGCDVIEYAAPQLRDTWLFSVTDLAYPFSHILMIVVGAAIVRAGVWGGWRRIPAFLVGFAVPVFIGLSIAFGRENTIFVFPLMVTAGFFLLGLAVFTTRQNSEQN
jgi:hypothetical protein